jgi:hypothetical protein
MTEPFMASSPSETEAPAGILFKSHIDLRLVAHLDFLGGVTQIRDDQCSTRLHVDGKVAIDAGNHTVRSTFFEHVGADDRTGSVRYDTCDSFGLLHVLCHIRRSGSERRGNVAEVDCRTNPHKQRSFSED